MTPPDLRRLFAPASIAVVGANERDGSYASQVLLNLRAIGYTGEVWGVNPGRSSALGYPCVASLADLPSAADAVVVAIPAAGVPQVIEQAGVRGCGGAVVISAGFGEVESGRALQAELVAAAGRHALPVCGPNCNGIVGMQGRYALWGDALVPREPGSVVLISQSGNVAVNALATRRGLRLHTVIASGNQAVLSAADYLAFMAGVEDVASVALYLEDDGDPSLCDALAACADADVRVAVLKVGTSAAGARAAAAHSAALTGDQRIFRALVEEAGAAWAGDVHELLELAKAFAVRRDGARASGRGLAIMTCSGGDSAQGADEATRLGVGLPPLGAETRTRLRELLPSAATVGNPIDYTAMIWGEVETLAALVALVGADPAIDQVLVFYDHPPGLDGAVEASWRAVREGLTAGAGRSPAPVMVASTLPELLDDAAAWRFIGSGIPAVAGLRTGLVCAAALMSEPGDAERLRSIARAARHVNGRLAPAARHVSGRLAPADGEWLSEHEAKVLLRDAGLPVVDGRLVSDAHDAVSALVELGGATVLKLSAASVQHKSELGAVILDLRTEHGMRDAYAAIAALASTHRGEVLAERMEDPAVELLVAARRDGVVPALTLGLGGVWTELLSDVAVVPLPATPERVSRALASLRGSRVLSGGRGHEALDVRAAAELAARIGELLLESDLALIECNPVLVKTDGALVLDALVMRSCPGTVEVSGTEVLREEQVA